MAINRVAALAAFVVAISMMDSVGGVPMDDQLRQKRQANDLTTVAVVTPTSSSTPSSSSTIELATSTGSGRTGTGRQRTRTSGSGTGTGGRVTRTTSGNFSLETSSMAATNASTTPFSASTAGGLPNATESAAPINATETTTLGNVSLDTSSMAGTNGTTASEASTAGDLLNVTEPALVNATKSTSVSLEPTSMAVSNETTLRLSSDAPTSGGLANATESGLLNATTEATSTSNFSMAVSTETTTAGGLFNSTESGAPLNSTGSIVMTTIGNLLTTIMSTFGSSAPSNVTTVVSNVTESTLVTELSSVSMEANGTSSLPRSTMGELNATETSPSSELFNVTTLATTAANASMGTSESIAPINETTVFSNVTETSLATENATSITGVSELVTRVSMEANGTSSLPETTLGGLNATETSPTSELSNVTFLATTTAGNVSMETTEMTMEASNTTILSTHGGLASESTIAFMTTSLAESSVQPGNVSVPATGGENSTMPSSVDLTARRQVPPNVFDCSKRQPGLYGNPREACDAKFYICTDPLVLAYEQPCAGHLYFDPDLKDCESWIHIPGCSGKPRPSAEPTHAPRNDTVSTAAPAIDCANRTDGNYPDPIGTIKPDCSNRYYTCIGGMTVEFRCPFHLIFDKDTDRCEREDHVFACTGEHRNRTNTTTTPAPTLPPVDFDCKGLSDGYYVVNCSSNFYSCIGGQARELHCPDGLVYDNETLACETPFNAAICTGTKRRPTKLHTTTEAIALNISTTESPMDCFGKPDGVYPDPTAKCSRYFYFCAHNESSRTECPANLFYDVLTKKCDLWLNVFDCSGLHPTKPIKTPSTPVPTFEPVGFDCLHRENGNYPNPKDKCSRFYYQCANMDAFKQDCPSDLFYDPDRDTCDSWIRVFACSKQTIPPTTPSTAAPNVTHPTTKEPLIDCSKKADGPYADPAKACSQIFFECSGGYGYELQCQDGLFYDVQSDKCDVFENVFACSKHTLAPTKPSTPSPKPTKPVEMPIDCMFLPDGDYEDPKVNCSNTYYSCSGGYAFKRNCPDKTFFDADRDQCDRYFNVFACSGRKMETTPAGPSTKRTPRPHYPFDCTKKYDGNYAAGECVQEYWACVGGLTFPLHCRFGLVYDEEFNDCEFPFLVPNCGGHRITPAPRRGSTPKKPVVFDCTFLADGNYPDPQAKDNCSSVFYSCSSGITSPLRCPDKLIFDPVWNSCDHREFVSACTGITGVVTKSTSSLATATNPTTLSSGTMGTGELTTSARILGNETTIPSTNETMTTLPSSETTETTIALVNVSTTVMVNGTTIALTTESSTFALVNETTIASANLSMTTLPSSQTTTALNGTTVALANISTPLMVNESTTTSANGSMSTLPSSGSTELNGTTSIGTTVSNLPPEPTLNGSSSSSGNEFTRLPVNATTPASNTTAVSMESSTGFEFNSTTTLNVTDITTASGSPFELSSTASGANVTAISPLVNATDSSTLTTSESALLNKTTESIFVSTSVANLNETTIALTTLIRDNATSVIDQSTSSIPSNATLLPSGSTDSAITTSSQLPSTTS